MIISNGLGMGGRRAWRMALPALAGLLLYSGGKAATPAGDQPDVITQIVDRSGKKLTAADLPKGLVDSADAARKAMLNQDHSPAYMGSALVLAHLVYPGSEKDRGAIAMLTGSSWEGGVVLPVSAEPNMPAIVLNSSYLDEKCNFRVRRMDYATALVPLPTPLARGTLVWLGDVALKPDTSPTVAVTGTVTDNDGRVLDVSGDAMLHPNGSWVGIMAKVKHGRYVFPGVHPGEHLVDARCDAYKIDSNFVTVNPSPKPSLAVVKAVLVPKSMGDIAAISTPAEGPWLTSFSEAKKASVAQKLPIFLDFTGSDWCGWCQVFDKEVFSTPEFLAFAKTHFILLRVDLPHQKQLPPEEMKQNQQLAAMFGVEGFPSFYVLSANGKIIFHQEGYSPGGPKPFLTKLQNLAEPKTVGMSSPGEKPALD